MGSSFRFLYASKLKTGDLVTIANGIDYANVYEDRLPFSFVYIAFKGTPGETGIILSRLEPESKDDTLHPQYVKVLFSRGTVGVIRASVLNFVC